MFGSHGERFARAAHKLPHSAHSCAPPSSSASPGRAYAAAGADVVFIEAPETIEQVAAIPDAVDRPAVFNWAFGGRSPTPSAEAIAGFGYKFLLCPDTVFAVTRTLADLYGEVRSNGTCAALAERMTGFDAFNDIVGFAEVAALDRRFGGAAAG